MIEKSITLESFVRNSGIKVVLKSKECAANVIELFIREDLLEYINPIILLRNTSKSIITQKCFY